MLFIVLALKSQLSLFCIYSTVNDRAVGVLTLFVYCYAKKKYFWNGFGIWAHRMRDRFKCYSFFVAKYICDNTQTGFPQVFFKTIQWAHIWQKCDILEECYYSCDSFILHTQIPLEAWRWIKGEREKMREICGLIGQCLVVYMHDMRNICSIPFNIWLSLSLVWLKNHTHKIYIYVYKVTSLSRSSYMTLRDLKTKYMCQMEQNRSVRSTEF